MSYESSLCLRQQTPQIAILRPGNPYSWFRCICVAIWKLSITGRMGGSYRGWVASGKELSQTSCDIFSAALRNMVSNMSDK